MFQEEVDGPSLTGGLPGLLGLAELEGLGFRGGVVRGVGVGRLAGGGFREVLAEGAASMVDRETGGEAKGVGRELRSTEPVEKSLLTVSLLLPPLLGGVVADLVRVLEVVEWRWLFSSAVGAEEYESSVATEELLLALFIPLHPSFVSGAWRMVSPAGEETEAKSPRVWSEELASAEFCRSRISPLLAHEGADRLLFA